MRRAVQPDEEDEHETRNEPDGPAAGGSPSDGAATRGGKSPRGTADRDGPAADNTDVYAFVSYDAANRTRGRSEGHVHSQRESGQDPADAPNFYNFDDDVLYAVNIDNNKDGRADDVVYEFRFKTENRPIGGPGGLTSPVPYLGNPHITGLGGLLQGITASTVRDPKG